MENPPPVNKELLYVSLLFDAIGLVLGMVVSWQFAIMILGIGMVSKAYSHPSIRLKKFPVLGLLTVALFQGSYTYLMSFLAINGKDFSGLAEGRTLYAAGLCSLMLLGSYPMTQIYQHGEDGRRGDQTMSRMLGIRGTFYWTAGIFAITTAGFMLYFVSYYNWITALVFPIFLMPTLIYFLIWFLKVWRNFQAADFKSTMRLNSLSSCCFVAFFLFLYVYQFI